VQTMEAQTINNLLNQLPIEGDISPQPIKPIAEELNVQKDPNEDLTTDQQNIS
ncbi:16201_t:CDS:2, partial [Racocetra persica]